MESKKSVWFVTGASRGIGACLVRAALEAGHDVVATARDRHAVAAAATAGQLLALDLDVGDEAQARAAAASALERFGRIDVLVNNAGYGQLGLFEEGDAGAALRQFTTNVFGLMNVTRAVLPAMRAQRSGHVFNLSSIAGVRGSLGASLYCSSKFAVEGFTESLAKEVAGFGIRATVVQPGFFRTEFLDPKSARVAGGSIADYAELTAQLAAGYAAANHRQPGDPDRLARVIIELAAHPRPPLRFAAGSDAVDIVRAKLDASRAELEAWRALSITTDGRYAA